MNDLLFQVVEGGVSEAGVVDGRVVQGEVIKSEIIEGAVVEVGVIEGGFPQGRVLPPLFFLLYTNDLQSVWSLFMVSYTLIKTI